MCFTSRTPRVQNIAEFCLAFGSAILVFLSSTILIGVITLFVGITPSAITAELALIPTALFAWAWIKRSDQDDKPARWQIGLIFIIMFGLLILFSLKFAGQFYDLSFDGQWYHARAIQQITSGWNPLRKPVLENTAGAIPASLYPKGAELAEAVLYRLSGSFEQSKAVNFMLLAACWLLSFSALLTLPGLKTIYALGLSILLALNPVILYQSLSFYVDGQIGALFTCSVALIFLLGSCKARLLYIPLSAILVFLINTKFTSTIYAAILCLAIWFGLWFLKDSRKWEVTIVMLVSFALGVLIVGYNPYITNTINGKWAKAIEASALQANTPENLREMSAPVKIFYSLFSKSAIYIEPVQLQAPFRISIDELRIYGMADTRTGGFGPIFGEAVVLITAFGLIILIYIFRRNPPFTSEKMILYLIGIVVLTVLVTPGAWWARYVPQAWIIPVLIILLGFLLTPKYKIIKLISICLFFLLISNSLLTAFFYLQYQTRGTDNLQNALAEISAYPHPVLVSFHYGVANQLRFEELGIEYIEVSDLSCPNQIQLSGMKTIVCPGK